MSKSNLAISMDDASNKGKFVELLTQLVVVGQKNGAFNKKLNTQDVAVVLAGTYFTVLAMWSHNEGRALREQLESSVAVVLKGLRA